VEKLADGGMILRSPQPLDPHESHTGQMLRRWAAERPEATFLGERTDGEWRRISYAETLRSAESVGQSLLERGMRQDRPLVILSGNSIDHALAMLGAMLAGVPVAPVSPAYSLMSQDHGKLRKIFELVEPAMIFAAPLAPFVPALGALDLRECEVVGTGPLPDELSITAFSELTKTVPGPALARAEAAVGPDTVAKILFTSGSTGLPKGVINTQRMLCANQQMVQQCWPFVTRTPPVLVDWLPWNHTFGGNHNFNLVLKQGGTLWIDDGKPAPGQIEQTLANLREISPTLYFNVPAGYAQLVPHLERDAELRESFFRELQMIFYAAAALPEDLWSRLTELSIQTRGEPVMMASGWGSTETAPLSTSVHFPIESAASIGLPPPGVEIKLVPTGPKTELRVRGPNVTPGYLGRADLTSAAFDEDGFYRIGDAGRLADAQDPARGLLFDGRIAEDFKLSSGTWVRTGALRVKALTAAAPALQDTLVTGHDRDYVGLLAWPNLQACADLSGDPDARGDPERLVRSEPVIERVRAGLRRHNALNPGSSTRIQRVILMTEPPNIDANEITDKGYVNQQAALARRADLVERLYRDPPDPDVISIEGSD
jgi:feruloyl-CoA synthase